jgi:hypothetical protein
MEKEKAEHSGVPVIPAKTRIVKQEDCGPGWANDEILSQK